MADTKISELAALSALEAGDLFVVVDVSDTSMAASGTNKRVTLQSLFGAVPLPVVIDASDPRLKLRQPAHHANTHTVLTNIASNQGQVGHQSNSGQSIFDIDSVAIDGAGASTVRFNRSTNTTGAVAVQFLRGNNSTTVDHKLVSGNSGTLAYLCLNGGNLQLGGGLTFGDEVLSEYDEGGWTIDLAGAATPGVWTGVTRFARYVRIGNLCFIYGVFAATGVSVAPVGNMWITGFPFAARNVTRSNCFSLSRPKNIAFGDFLSAEAAENTTHALLYKATSGLTGGHSNVSIADVGTAPEIRISGCYEVA